MKRFTRLTLPIGVLLIGLVLSTLLGQVLQHSATRDWQKRAEHEAARRSTVLLSWIEENYATLSALVALVENSSNVDSGEFLNAVDGLEARTKVNFMPAKALLERGTGGWSVKYSSAAPNSDAAFPKPSAPVPKLLHKTVTLAESTPNEWFLSSPFSSSGSKQFVYVVMVPASRTEVALVGVLGVQRMAETLLDSDRSDGLSLELKVKPQDDSAGGVVKVSKGGGVAVHHSESLTQTAHANLELAWDFAPTFDGGVDRRLPWSVGGACGLLSALLALFVVGVNRQKLRNEKAVKDATAELAAALQKAEDEASSKAQVTNVLLNLQRVGSYGELSTTIYSGLAPLLELGQASLYRADLPAERLVLCGAYARAGSLSPADTLTFGEGLVGQCAVDKGIVHLAEPPVDYITVQSGLGSAVPAAIVIAPILSAGALLGVMELACLKPFGVAQQHMLDHLLPMIAMSMEVIARTESTQRLLSSTQEQAQALEQQRGEIERLLQEQERIFQEAPHGIIYTADGIMLRANKRVAEYFGTTVDQLVGQASQSIYSSEEDFRRLGAIVGPQLAAGKDVHLEWQFVRKDGTPFFAMISGQGIRLAGHTRAAVWMFEDISERKKLEQSMKEDEARLRQILENSPAGVSINNEAGVPIFSNRRVAELLGISTQDLGKRNTKEFWGNQPDREIFLEQIHREGKVIDYKADFVRADGTPLTVLLSSMFIDVADGSNLVTWIYDISDREKTESALRQANAEQTAIFETARVGIALTKDRIFVRCNPYIEQVFGYESGGLIGKSTRVMFPDDEAFARIGQGMLAAFGRGETYRNEVEFMRKDGSRFMGRVHGSMVDFKDPSRGVVLMGEDITDERATAATLDRAKAISEEVALTKRSSL